MINVISEIMKAVRGWLCRARVHDMHLDGSSKASEDNSMSDIDNDIPVRQHASILPQLKLQSFNQGEQYRTYDQAVKHWFAGTPDVYNPPPDIKYSGMHTYEFPPVNNSRTDTQQDFAAVWKWLNKQDTSQKHKDQYWLCDSSDFGESRPVRFLGGKLGKGSGF